MSGEMPPVRILSLSGGKDSTALLLMSVERGEPFDAVAFMDTGWEFPELLEHVKCLRKVSPVPIMRVTTEHSFMYYLCEHKRNHGVRKGIPGYGFATPKMRWCTKLKNKALRDWAKRAYPGRRICWVVGLAADESHRVKRDEWERGEVDYPLVRWGVTESECLAYCRERGYDWGGLYEHMSRVSCWCCPLQTLKSLRALYEHHPALWGELKEMQSRSIRPFRTDWTLEGMEKLFSLKSEEEMEAR